MSCFLVFSGSVAEDLREQTRRKLLPIIQLLQELEVAKRKFVIRHFSNEDCVNLPGNSFNAFDLELLRLAQNVSRQQRLQDIRSAQ